jgi:hypothetical protein
MAKSTQILPVNRNTCIKMEERTQLREKGHNLSHGARCICHLFRAEFYHSTTNEQK